MDYIDKSKMVIYESYENFLKKKKYSRVILMTTKAKKNYNNFKFNRKDTLLFGRESEGVPKKVHNNSFQRLRIPLKKKCQIAKYWYGCGYSSNRSLKTKFKFVKI